MKHRFVALLFIILLLGLVGVVGAQESTPEPTDVPTEVPTEVPTDIPTEIPTEEPTDIPTEVPTDIPTEVPTDTPTDVPTEVPTDAPTEEPSAPPVFSLASGTAFSVVAGTALNFDVSVADETGVVRVVASASAAGFPVIVTSGSPAETAAPFNTPATVTYTAAAEFSGADSFTLTAVDAAGTSASITIVVNVEALPSTVEPTPEPTTVPTEVRLINFNPAASEEAIQALLSAMSAVELYRIPQIGAMKVLVPANVADLQSATAALAGNTAALQAGLTSVEMEVDYNINVDPTDTLYPQQWGLDSSYGVYAENAWTISPKDGTGVVVAVLDSGVDLQHPDLLGKFAAGGWDFVNDDNNPDDDNSHGTHVAGVISAATNNAKGIAGLAFNSRILPVKVCTAGGSCPTLWIAAGIVHAVDKGAKVINMSLGGGTISTTVEGAVQYAIARNVVVVASAGNTYGTSYQYPASYPNVISVAAHDINGVTADFSTSNDRVWVSAPGVNILSTVPFELDLYDGLQNGYDGTFSGTSMAAPHVAAIVAIMVGDGVVSTVAQAREALACAAWDIGSAATVPGFDNDYGYGYVQADWALNWRNNSSNCKVTAPNDLYQNAINIPTVPFNTTQAIHSRSVTTSASDPSICGNTQSLWYKFKPTVSDYYQFSTFGSSYNTYISIYEMPEEGFPSTNFIGCNDNYGGFTTTSLLSVGLTAGRTYYIMVHSSGFANDQILNLDVRRGLFSNNVDNQESSLNIAYTGTWAITAQTGASGGSVRRTTDDSATVSFVFRGIAFDYARTVGPTMGSTEVWIDGALQYTISNRAAVTRANQTTYLTVPLGTSGEWHQIVLRRASAGPAGPIDIDRIRTYDSGSFPTTPVTAITDSGLGGAQPCAAKRFCYEPSGTFVNLVVPGAHLNTVSRTTSNGASVSFRATGSTITIFRGIGPGYGSADVYVDGVYWSTMDNNHGTFANKVPYIIDGLTPFSHTVQVINNPGSTLDFDAAQASTPTAILAGAAQTNENSPTIVYGGVWSALATPGALGATTRQTSDPDARVSFSYTGNYFCINYTTRPSTSAVVDVYQDGYYIGTINVPSAPLAFNNLWCDPLLRSDRTHLIVLDVASGTFELDGVWARRQVVLLPSNGLVVETNTAFTYGGLWSTFTGRSLGGYTFQGGSARSTSQDGAYVRFYMNGTGFILYTSTAPDVSGWEVYVDGVLYPITFQNVNYNYIDLRNAGRFRPIGYGVTGLSPGIHIIELRKWVGNPGLDFADFDGVRVFP